MILSMTGFGRGEAAINGGTFSVEMRSVNHRYIDFSIRLPRTLANFESGIKELIKSRVQRGYVTYQLTWDREEREPAELVINEEALRRYLELFQKMNVEFGVEGRPTVDSLSRLPDVFKAVPISFDEGQLWKGAEQATNKALEGLLKMREIEGGALAADISGRLEVMVQHIGRAIEKAPERLKRLEDSLREKVRAAYEGVLDENRLLTEITYYADKWDFSEEDVRFRTHVEAMRETLVQGGAVGRKLSFLVQELNREANTVASKANDAEIAQLMIAIKEEIEKVREQVENLE